MPGRDRSLPLLVTIALVSSLAIALPLVDSQPTPKPRVAAVLPSRTNDLSWTQALHAGLERLTQEQKIEYSFTEEVEPADAERVLRRLAERRPSLIIAHSATYRDAVFNVAREFPQQRFAWSSFGTQDRRDNLAAYDTPVWEAAYLAGGVAAHVSQSGRIGFVGGLALPGCRAIFNALREGAIQAKAGVDLTPVYVGTFLDIGKAKALALSLNDRGIDVVAACGNGPARGAIEAMRERKGWAIGYIHDMAPLAPQTVLGSLVWDGYAAMRQIVSDLEAGAPAGRYYPGSAREGVTGFKLNESIVPALPPAAVRALEESRARIRSGALSIPISFQ
jgi:basic membrane protein A